MIKTLGMALVASVLPIALLAAAPSTSSGQAPPTSSGQAPPTSSGQAPASQPTVRDASPQATQPFDSEAAAKLIRQLGDDDFAVREAATAKLIAMGDAAKPMLVEKSKEKGLDAEAADRIQKVIAELDRRHWPALTGKVVDPRGNPVANVRVECAGPDAPDVTADVAWTQADGTFVFRLPPGAEYKWLKATHGELQAFAKNSIKPKADQTTDVGVMKLASFSKQ